MTAVPAAASSAGRARLPGWRAIAFAAGFAGMTLEVTAVRLLAPFFGDSAYVWTNAIGVMLAALAAGAWLGGRLADRGQGERIVAWVLGIAGLWAIVAPFVARAVAGWFMDASLPLDVAFRAMVNGSLAATALLFGPAAFFLGMVSPLLIRLAADHGVARVGRASGGVYAWGTVGSLLGTFLPTHLLIPQLGSRATVHVAATVLLAAGIWTWARWRRPTAMLAVALVVGLGVASWGTACAWPPLRPTGAGEVLLAEVESRYQFLQVVEHDADGIRERVLRINEGLDSFHSVTRPGSALTGGRYYDAFLTLPALFPERTLTVASLGSAGGTFQRGFRMAYGDRVRCVGIELDAACVDLGRRHMDLRPEDTTLLADARLALAHMRERFDLLLLDTYRHQIYLPSHLTSVEFFRLARERLAPEGVLAVNVGDRSMHGRVVTTIANSMAAVFGEAVAIQVPGSRNFVVLARLDAAVDPEMLWANAERLPGELRPLAQELSLPGRWRRMPYQPGLPVPTDDRPCLEALHDALYWDW